MTTPEKKITVGSLFSGIEGFGLGFEQAGMEIIWNCERDANCRKLLAKRFPNTKSYDDVRTIGKRNAESPDVICGGFPCQDLSVAGKRAGLSGERSGLWHEFHRILDEMRPRIAVIENVPGLLSGCGCFDCQVIGRFLAIHSRLRRREYETTGERRPPCDVCVAGKRLIASHSGRNFAVVLRGLAELGYGVAWRVLDSQFFGVPQRRRRVFVVGSLGNGSAAEILFEPESVCGNPAPQRETGKDVARCLTESSGGSCDGETENFYVAPTLYASGAGTDRTASAGNEAEFCIPIQYAEQLGREERQNGMGVGDDGDPEYTLECRQAHGVAVAFQQNQRDEVRALPGYAGALPAQPGMKQQNYIAQHLAVRRLMPIECERLQGFPDNWSDGFADSVRYRMLGNAVTVNVARWLGKRIVKHYGN